MDDKLGIINKFSTKGQEKLLNDCKSGMNDHLKVTRMIKKAEVVAAYNKYKHFRLSMLLAREEWERLSREYMELDKNHAEQDGRLTIVPSPDKKKKTTVKKQEIKIEDLNIEQLKNLAKKFGVKV